MFDFDVGKLIVIGIVALIVIGCWIGTGGKAEHTEQTAL